MIVRGVEGLPVVLGDLELPASARLKIHRVDPTVMANLELVTLAEAPAGTSGALLRVNFDAFGPNFGFLEACMRLVTDGATNPIFLSSGAEGKLDPVVARGGSRFTAPPSTLLPPCSLCLRCDRQSR